MLICNTRFRHPTFLLLVLLTSVKASGLPLYQFGNPTADEQAYIELINQARTNPAAEGARLATATAPDILAAYAQYKVNLVVLQNEFNAISAAPPLAPNAALTTAARGHSQWMLNNAIQSHNETNPSNDTLQRIRAAGYDEWFYGENIYAYVKNIGFGHAGFEVDWATAADGMLAGRGHRANIHDSDFSEIGVGSITGTNGQFGPQLVTQDFGSPFDGQTFGTGVAFYDLNSNNLYDVGEGIAGLTVNVNGATHYCTTATGGGWVVPIPSAAATRTVTFSGLGINQSKSLTVPSSANAKVDLKLAYTPASITSAATAASGNVHTFTFTAVGGATGYKWNRWNSAAAQPENCEAMTNVTLTTNSGYQVVNTSVKQEGAASFHLVSPGTIGNQIVELNTLFHGQTSASLTFQSRLRNSTASEHHKVQVKQEGSSTWQEVYNQDGGIAEASFTLKTVSLSTMVGKKFRIRFILNFPGGNTFSNTGDANGWFIDAISFFNVSTLSGNVSQTLTGTSSTFTPGAGNYLFSVAPIISGIEFPSTDQPFTATAPALTFSTWAATFETNNSLAAGTISNNPNADYDKDGRVNLIEYAFGTSPLLANETAPRIPILQPSSSHFIIRYTRDTALTDITLLPVASSDFTTWKSPGQSGAAAGFTDSVISTTATLEIHEAKIPRTSGAKWFMRLKVTKP
jgi:hypothetical protein